MSAVDAGEAAAAAVARRLAGRLAPGVVGIATRARVQDERGEVWSAAQIELWREEEQAWLRRSAAAGPAEQPDSEDAARIGLAAADSRVRDTLLHDAAGDVWTAGRTADLLGAAAQLLPQPWRGPTATAAGAAAVLADRDPRPLLVLAGGPVLGGMLWRALREPAGVGALGAALRSMSYDQVRHGWTGRDAEADRAQAEQLERNPMVVLGAALGRAGWALDITAVDASPKLPGGEGVLLHDHLPAAAIRFRGSEGAALFPGGPQSQAWEAATSDSAGTGEALTALLVSGAMDLEAPHLAGRVAVSLPVLARTDRLTAARRPQGRGRG